MHAAQKKNLIPDYPACCDGADERPHAARQASADQEATIKLKSGRRYM